MADSEHEKIYNKNAREKALLEEAYTDVYNEGSGIDWKRATTDGEPSIPRYHRQMKERGHRKFKGPEGTTGATYPPGKTKSERAKIKKEIEDKLEQGYTEIGIGEHEEGASTAFSEEGRHRLGVEMVHNALEMFNKALHVYDPNDAGESSKDAMVEAHRTLSVALHNIFNPEQAEKILGGAATQKAYAELDFKPADGREF